MIHTNTLHAFRKEKYLQKQTHLYFILITCVCWLNNQDDLGTLNNEILRPPRVNNGKYRIKHNKTPEAS